MSTTRRTILAGLAALPVISAAAMPASVAPDLTFALIERHRTARAILNAMPGDIEGTEPEALAEEAAMAALVEREPTTLAGLRSFAEYFDDHSSRSGDESAQWALATIAEACRNLIGGEA